MLLFPEPAGLSASMIPLVLRERAEFGLCDAYLRNYPRACLETDAPDSHILAYRNDDRRAFLLGWDRLLVSKKFDEGFCFFLGNENFRNGLVVYLS